MPHDYFGQVLEVGQKVLVPCRIKEIHPGENFCNLTLETTQPMFPSDSKTVINANALQVFSGIFLEPIHTKTGPKEFPE